MADLRLVKIDVHAGRTGVWGDRAFRKGVHEARGLSDADVGRLAAFFQRCYGSLPEPLARAEFPELFTEKGPYNGDHPILGAGTLRRLGDKPAQGPTAGRPGDAATAPVEEWGKADAGGRPERPAQDGVDDPAGERRLHLSDPDDDGSVTVAEVDGSPPEPVVAQQERQASDLDADVSDAVGRLDPEDDAHWNSQSLPSMEAISGLVGRKVTRREVDRVASGYTRASARRAKEV